MERTIDEVAGMTGLTTRTLRHRGDVGLLSPSSTTTGGRRRYDEAALVRLQRILLLRDLGLGLGEIGAVLDRDASPVDALTRHLDALRIDRERLARRIRAVQDTVRALERGEPLMAEEMFDGFDHKSHRDEVEERWGADAWATGDTWWRSMDVADRAGFRERMTALQRDRRDAAGRGIRPDGDEAQALAARQVAWLAEVPGTPEDRDYLRGLGGMCVANRRFAVRYGGAAGAAFVRDALAAWADRDAATA